MVLFTDCGRAYLCVMKKAKDSIPVYDICSLADTLHLQDDIIAEHFAAYLERHPLSLHRPHRHSFYHLVCFTKGSGTHTVDFEQFAVKPGQIYFMIPGQVHSWQFEGAMDGYIVNFSEALMQSLFRDGVGPEQFSFFNGNAADGVIQLKGSKPTVMVLLESIITEVDANNSYSREMICMHLMSLFIHISREIANDKTKPVVRQNQLLLQNFRKLVNEYYNRKRLPKEYAAMLYVTPNHLNALCNDLLGRSAGEVIRDRVLLEAKRLLVNADINISEIAFQLDFKDNSYFTRFFKKYTGTTPEDFRRSVINSN